MRRLRTSWLPWWILALTLVVTWAAWNRERRVIESELKEHFEDSTRATISRIEQRMAAFEQLLRGVQAQYAATGRNDRQALHGYVESIESDANFTGILAVGYATWVPAAQKEQHEAVMRRSGWPNYRIQPEGPRDGYAPVDQREPDSRPEQFPYGFDPWSEPVRRQAMERARDSGLPAVSGKVQLVVDQTSELLPGFVMYLPVYARGQPTFNVQQRRTALVGWYFGAFRMRDLMASLYGQDPPGVALTINDGVELSTATQLYGTPAANDPENGSILTRYEYLVFGGHTWTLTITATQTFADRFGRDASLIVWSGIGLGLALALIAWLLVGREAHAQALAMKMTQDLRESERRWAFALEGAGDGVWDWNLQTRAVVTSKRWREIVGCTDSDRVETIDAWEARAHPDDQIKVHEAMESSVASHPEGNSAYAAEYRIRCGDGRWKWILARGMVVERTADGQPLRMIGTISDIDERKATEERMRHMAQHDPLTGLPNRALFSDRVQRELAHASRRDERFALIFLDLDRFKPVNDNFGHATGDQLLRLVARRIEESLRQEDTVGRIGGDEFVILVSRLQSPDDALALAEKVLEAIRRPFVIESQVISISCSLGVAVYPEDGTDEITLFKHADDRMYAAKAAGRDRVQMAAGSSGHAAWPSPPDAVSAGSG